MRDVKKLYPGGKARAMSFSYDDGVLQDVRFVDLLNRYGLKGTFNLNSGLMDPPFSWTHSCGRTITRLTPREAAGLYDGHEIASHTLTHPYMHNLSWEQVMDQLSRDKANLERMFQRQVSGFAVPFTYYSERIAQCARECGFEYARISEESGGCAPGGDWYHWKGTIFHWSENLEAHVEHFLQTNQELALCQIVGHSYDLDVFQMWERMEAICQSVSKQNDVWPATTFEIVRYLKAMEKAAITQDAILNNSSTELWFRVQGTVIVLKPYGVYMK